MSYNSKPWRAERNTRPGIRPSSTIVRWQAPRPARGKSFRNRNTRDSLRLACPCQFLVARCFRLRLSRRDPRTTDSGRAGLHSVRFGCCRFLPIYISVAPGNTTFKNRQHVAPARSSAVRLKGIRLSRMISYPVRGQLGGGQLGGGQLGSYGAINTQTVIAVQAGNGTIIHGRGVCARPYRRRARNGA